jgi:thiol-disulfide isomerase/thioredoxin
VFRLPLSARHAGRATLGAAAAAAVLLSAAACDAGATAQQTAVGNGSSFVAGSYATTVYRPGSRPAAPQVTATTLSGGRFQLSADRGAVVVLNFWGSWCTPCRVEAPVLSSLSKHYTGTSVRFLGVDIRDSPAAAEAFLSDAHISYPSFNDPGDEIALGFTSTVPPSGIPTTLVIGRNGRVSARVIGEVSYPGLRGLISRAVAGPA